MYVPPVTWLGVLEKSEAFTATDWRGYLSHKERGDTEDVPEKGGEGGHLERGVFVVDGGRGVQARLGQANIAVTTQNATVPSTAISTATSTATLTNNGKRNTQHQNSRLPDQKKTAVTSTPTRTASIPT